MTAISQQEKSIVQADRPPLGRTFAMTLVSGGCWVMAASLAYFLVLFGPAAADLPQAALLLPLFILMAVVFGIIGAFSVFWTGARRRAWFWLVAVVPALLLLLLNARRILHDITRPANTNGFLLTIVVLAAALIVIVGGIAAFLDVRRGRATWTRAGRAGWVMTAVIGVVVGGATTSLLAGSASAEGGGVASAPTITGVVTAQDTTFVETGLAMKNGDVLGLFLINKDAIGHAFDIDSLDIHAQLPPNSTTAVAIKPTAAGGLEFYCSVPGHREAGMVGTITVE
jgi:plastocyanin